MKMTTMAAARLSHLINERRSRASLERHQIVRFRKLVRYLRKHSPYYRDLIAERKINVTACVPTDFPVLTKTELMRNFDRISTDSRVTRAGVADFLERSRDPFELYRDAFYVLHSSGSSGEVGFFVFSKEDWSRGVAPGLRFVPLRLKKQRLIFFGVSTEHVAGVNFALTCSRSLLKLLYDVRTFDINSPLGSIVEELNRFQPDIVMGYASAIGMLAECQKRGELHIRPRSVQSSGEVVRAADRALVEEAFGVPMLNIYTCSEHLITGYGRSGFGGMYLFEDELFFELMPDHILVTNLFNYTLPLIRYRMGDVMIEVPDPDPVYPFRKIKEEFGRSEQIPYFRNAAGKIDFLSPHAINALQLNGVKRFQLVVKDKTSCLIRVCPAEGLSDAARRGAIADVRAKMSEVLVAKNMGNVAVAIEEVDDLPVDPRTGKFRLIVPEGG
jgi:phenylacetate-coenzyme A ligase PaaK-like adenylate-forming protein